MLDEVGMSLDMSSDVLDGDGVSTAALDGVGLSCEVPSGALDGTRLLLEVTYSVLYG